VCTITESDAGGATTLSGACNIDSGSGVACGGGGTDPVLIDFSEAAFGATVTFTNDFAAPSTTAAPTTAAPTTTAAVKAKNLARTGRASMPIALVGGGLLAVGIICMHAAARVQRVRRLRWKHLA